MHFMQECVEEQPVMWDQTACVFGVCVAERQRGQTQARGDYQATLDNTQVADLGA